MIDNSQIFINLNKKFFKRLMHTFFEIKLDNFSLIFHNRFTDKYLIKK